MNSSKTYSELSHGSQQSRELDPGDAIASGKVSGALDGRTVLRFAHAFERGGGTERYLDDLDRVLLERNAMSIMRIHLTRKRDASPTEEVIGRGRLICVPLPVILGENPHAPSDPNPLRSRLKQVARDWVLYNPFIWWLFGAKWTTNVYLQSQTGQAIGAGSAASEIMKAHRVDMVMLHYFGGADADEVVLEARKAGVPFAVLNHYSNDRFLHLAIRKHVMAADGIAGVNGLELPRYIQGRFSNLSDGIDTEFFRRSEALVRDNVPIQPVILLPARVIREKGQLDLIRSLASLRKRGQECCVVFAGRVDSSDFVDELLAEIKKQGIVDRVHFLGDLSVSELRDWYAASAIVAFPTYHHEGLGRVIVEAQAMGLPVVAYATGGVAEGIVQNETGYLLQTGDVSGLTERLHELLADPALRKMMGNRGRLEAEKRFSLATLANRHEKFYAKVISNFEAGSMKPLNRSTGVAP